MFTYTSGNTGVDYLTEIDVGIWEQQLDDRAWEMWVKAKRDIAAVALAHNGSISACHGSCREGEVDLVPDELGRGFDVMLDLKRTARPEQHHEPRQVPPRPGLRDRDTRMSDESANGTPIGYRYAEQFTPPEPQRVSDVAITTHEHVFEVDPRLMERWVLQQSSPTGTACGS